MTSSVSWNVLLVSMTTTSFFCLVVMTYEEIKEEWRAADEEVLRLELEYLEEQGLMELELLADD